MTFRAEPIVRELRNGDRVVHVHDRKYRGAVGFVEKVERDEEGRQFAIVAWPTKYQHNWLGKSWVERLTRIV